MDTSPFLWQYSFSFLISTSYSRFVEIGPFGMVTKALFHVYGLLLLNYLNFYLQFIYLVDKVSHLKIIIYCLFHSE